ncbi:MAG: prolyl aminopeptidase [Parachlamydiales bacterium]|nr:prolyl aminopeptidase [Parachlamydiales bacterium]
MAIASMNILSAAISFSHELKETTFDQTLYPISKPREEGYLKVSDVHTLFYATYGNPKGIPIIVLHGGPGGGCSDDMTEVFDLSQWNVIMFDQRGAMRSTPFCSMEDNTPQHLVEDIEKLRNHLGIEKWCVFGGSWGSTLALLYGQAHSDHCMGFILRGIFLGNENNYMHLIRDMGKTFPEAYEPYINHIPVEERGDLLTAYYNRIFDQDPNIHLPAINLFMKLDGVAASCYPNPESVNKLMAEEKLIFSVARAFFHYSKNKFFLEPNQILSNMDKIQHLPAIIVQGRWDTITPPHQAFDVYKNWPNSQLWMVTNGGHTCCEKSVASGLVIATDLFLKKFNSK